MVGEGELVAAQQIHHSRTGDRDPTRSLRVPSPEKQMSELGGESGGMAESEVGEEEEEEEEDEELEWA